MLQSHKLDIERSEKRERLTEISAKEGELTAEERAEIASLSKKMKDIEIKYRAALVAEDTESDKPEAREAKDLVDKLSIRAYLSAVANGNPLQGREAEYNAEHGLASNAAPWEAIAPRERADAVSPGLASGDGPVTQHSILSRVFARSATQFLGVAMPSVGVGVHSYPVLTAGVAPEFKAKDAVVESTAATLSTTKAEPSRLTAKYSWRIEDTAVTEELESALRNDLSMAFSNALDAQVIAGNGTSPNLAGFLATKANGGLAAAAGSFAPSGVITYENMAKLLSGAVDGKHATALSDIRILVGPSTYSLLASTFRTGTSASALDWATNAVSMRVSANLPAVASNKEQAIIVRGNPANEAIVPVWSSVKFVKDSVTDIDKGWEHIISYALYSFVRVRDDAFARASIQVSS